MRIGIDARYIASAKPTGIGTYMLHILKQLSHVDHENEYILYSNQPIECSIDLGPNFIRKAIPGKVGTLWLRYTLPKYLVKDKIQVFWGQHFLPLPVKGVKMCLTIHDTALLIDPRWGSTVNSLMQKLFLRSAAKEADRIIAVSQSTKNDVVRLCGVEPDKIAVIYEGSPSLHQNVSVANEQAMLDKLGITGPYYLYLGTIEPRKNIDTIVKAFELLAAEDPSVQLVIAGSWGWRYESVKLQIEGSPFNSRILLPGYVSLEEKFLLYRNALAFVFVSHYEGFGIPVLEAYAMGTSVITANNSSLPEVAGDAAWYVQKHTDFQELARVMGTMRTVSTQDRSKKAQLGRERCKRFTWKKCAEHTLHILVGEE